MTSHEQYTHRILTELEAGSGISQRSLSRSVGIALGLTNLLIRRVVSKGWVRVIHIKPNRVKYLLTPTGIAEKARMSRDALHNSMRFYAEARDRIHERFTQLSAECASAASADGGKRIVFFGAGEVAEIAYVCLQGTDLTLVGVVDDRKSDHAFFGVPICQSAGLAGDCLNGVRYDRLVVMSFAETEKIRAQLDALAIPSDRVFWI